MELIFAKTIFLYIIIILFFYPRLINVSTRPDTVQLHSSYSAITSEKLKVENIFSNPHRLLADL